MGVAYSVRCRSCGHVEEGVTPRFACGMSGVVYALVLCPTHGLISAETGLATLDGLDWEPSKGTAYPCPECGNVSPVWNRRTCPECGKKSMGIWPEGPITLWD